MGPTSTIKRLGAGLLLAVTLSGCANPKDIVVLACPTATVLSEAESLTRFKPGPGRDLIDVDFDGEITGIRGKCNYDINDDTGAGTIEMEIRTEFEFTRGPANTDGKAAYEYFIVLANAASEPFYERRLPLITEFWTNRTVITDTDGPVKLSIPISADQSGDNFLIFVGFQLSPDELQYNRNR